MRASTNRQRRLIEASSLAALPFAWVVVVVVAAHALSSPITVPPAGTPLFVSGGGGARVVVVSESWGGEGRANLGGAFSSFGRESVSINWGGGFQIGRIHAIGCYNWSIGREGVGLPWVQSVGHERKQLVWTFKWVKEEREVFPRGTR